MELERWGREARSPTSASFTDEVDHGRNVSVERSALRSVGAEAAPPRKGLRLSDPPLHPTDRNSSFLAGATGALSPSVWPFGVKGDALLAWRVSIWP